MQLSFIFHRTKVECGGQCLSYSSCDSFNFVGNVCKLLKYEFLYKDPTTQTEVYESVTTAKGKN